MPIKRIDHIAIVVDDIDASLVFWEDGLSLKLRGVQLINEQPTIGTGGKQIAFIHPKSTGGVLVELYQLTPDEPRRRSKIIRDMRRRLVVQGYVAGAGLREFIRAWRGRDGLRRMVETPDEKLRIN